MSGSRKCTVCNKGWLFGGKEGGCKTCAARAALQPVVQPEATTTTARPNTIRPNTTNTPPNNTNTSSGGRGASPTGPISVALGSTDTILLNPRRGSATIELPEQTTTPPPSLNPVPQVQPSVATTRPATATVSPVQTGRPDLMQQNQRLKNALDTITNAPQQERQRRAGETAVHIMSLDEDQLAARTPEDNVQALAILTSVNVRTNTANNTYTETTPEPQMAALARLYENMKLDPNFDEHDKIQRDAILNSIANDPAAQNLSDVDWTPRHQNETAAVSETRLQNLQTLQTQHMPPNMIGNNDRLQLVNSLSDGSSGVCNGKKVKVSADRTKNHSFDETINTVVHETTHAYQTHLSSTIDTMPLDDPRYLQAQMFKFNAMGYCSPPDPLPTNPTEQQTTDRERLYKAYRNQPMERHAWQAGNEAGRLFDARAGALASVQTAARVTRFTPDSGQEATALAEQIRTGTNQQRAAAMLDLDVLAEQAMGRAAEAISRKLAEPGCVELITARAWNAFETRRVGVLNDHQGKPATRLQTLDTIRNEIDDAFVDGQARQAKENEVSSVSAAISQRLRPSDVVLWLGNNRWTQVEANRVNIVNARTNVDLKLQQIKQLHDDLGSEIEAAKQALEQRNAQQADREVQSRITNADRRLARLLQSEDMKLIASQFDSYNQRRTALVSATTDAKQRATNLEQLEADLTAAQRAAKQIHNDLVVASNDVVALLKDNLSQQALGGAQGWNDASARRKTLREGKADPATRLNDLRQLKTEIDTALTQARLAETAASQQFDLCWAIFSAADLPSAVYKVATEVQNLRPRLQAVARLKGSKVTLDYLDTKGMKL